MSFSRLRCRLTGDQETTFPPSRYQRLPEGVRPSQHLALFANLPLDVHKLQTLRAFALHGSTGQSSCEARHLTEIAQQWCRFLLGDGAAPSSSYLAGQRLHDKIFYRRGERGTRANPRPLPRASWPPGWSVVLAWLQKPQDLTSAELELALAIFDWREPEPRLRAWAIESPQLLHRVQGFLLRRYCFALLVPLAKAARAAGFFGPAYRAGELWWLFPRTGGLAAVGLLALASYDNGLTLFFSGGVWQLAAGLIAMALLWSIIAIDVFKQSRGVLVSRRHAFRRTRSQFLCFLIWGLALTAIYAVAFRCAPISALDDMEVRKAALPAVVAGAVALASASTALGGVLQWFWDDKSAAEAM